MDASLCSNGTEGGPAMRMLWLTDLHLDGARRSEMDELLARLRERDYECLLITGDTSSGIELAAHLNQVLRACGPKRLVYWIPGNHDFYDSSFSEVRRVIALLDQRWRNFIPLENRGVLALSASTALIGHGGWPDGECSSQYHPRWDPDFQRVLELLPAARKREKSVMAQMAAASTQALRGRLAYALQRYERVLVASHVPPFWQCVQYGGNSAGPAYLPHYTNRRLGGMILAMAGQFPGRRIDVYSGHTHSETTVHLRFGVTARVSAPSRKLPGLGHLLTIS